MPTHLLVQFSCSILNLLPGNKLVEKTFPQNESGNGDINKTKWIISHQFASTPNPNPILIDKHWFRENYPALFFTTSTRKTSITKSRHTMGSSNKKKKEKLKDFQKPKLKVGKTKAKASNFTNTSFKSKGAILFSLSLSPQ